MPDGPNEAAADLVGVEDAVICDIAEGAVAGRDNVLEQVAVVRELLHPDVQCKGSLPAPLHSLDCQAGSCNHEPHYRPVLDLSLRGPGIWR